MNGVIGFFDILGYQVFLENNSATDSALEVLETITQIPVEIMEFTAHVVGKTRIQDKEFQAAFKYLVFSDTIVFTLPYPDNPSDEWTRGAITFMGVCSSLLAAKMLMKGLPIRGVIHVGDFVTKDYCLAGKGIVEAYRLCESLDFSSVVYSESLTKNLPEMHQIVKNRNDGNFIYSYLTPLTDGRQIKIANVNWLNFVGPIVLEDIKNDVEKYVLESFWAHQKDCSTAVDSKVRNTVKVLRKMIQNIQFNDAKKPASKAELEVKP